jgi:hypothetical protein
MSTLRGIRFGLSTLAALALTFGCKSNEKPLAGECVAQPTVVDFGITAGGGLPGDQYVYPKYFVIRNPGSGTLRGLITVESDTARSSPKVRIASSSMNPDFSVAPGDSLVVHLELLTDFWTHEAIYTGAIHLGQTCDAISWRTDVRALD